MRGALWQAVIPYRVLYLARAILARPRLVMWIQVALVLYAVMVLAAPPAEAAPPNPLSALDREDAAGYLISNYNLTFLTSVTNPGEGMTAWLVGNVLWEVYRWGIAIAALIIDLTLGFKWLEYLIYPVEQVAIVLDNLLDQLPMVRELLIALAIGVGIFRMWVGQVSRGVTDMIGSLAAWGLGAAVLTNPVTWITGPEGLLTRTKEAAQQLSAQLVNPAAAAGDVDQSEAAGSFAQQLATTFVRAPHQFVAYGGLADGGGCEAHYNENLTGTGKELAEEMAKCSPDFAQNIEHPSGITLVTMFIILLGAAILIGIAMVCSVMILLEAANILIAAAMGTWELFRAVGPGGSYRGLFGLFIEALGAVLAMLWVIFVQALYLAAVMHFLTTWETHMIVVFLMVDLVLVVTLIVLFKQRKKLAKQIERMKERTRTQKTQAAGPRRLPTFGHGGVAAGLGQVAGQKVAGSAGRLGSKVARGSGRAVKGATGVATAPARAATRRVSRPGFMAARLGTGVAKRAGIRDRASLGAIRGLAYKGGERKWTKAEAKRAQRRDVKAEKRRKGQFWTWGGARRDADEQAAELAAAGAPPAGRPRRRPLRRTVHENPASTSPGQGSRGSHATRPKPRSGPTPASRKGRAPEQARSTRAAAGKGGRTPDQTGPKTPSTASAGRADGPAQSARTAQRPASERLRQRMRSQRRTSTGSSGTVRSRARSSQRARQSAA